MPAESISIPAIPHLGTLLFADDDDAFRLATSEILRRRGYRVLEARDSQEALFILQKGAVDLVIADVHMPGNTTLHFVRELEESRPGVPIIVVTGRPSVETAAQSVRLRVLAYLPKPLDYSELFDVIGEAMKLRGVWNALNQSRSSLSQWMGDLDLLGALVKDSGAVPPAVAWQHFLELSTGHALQALGEIRGVVENRPPGVALPKSEEADTETLLTALKDTILVLEQTKRAFKSNQLGSLRARLEGLAATTPPPATSPQR